MKLISLRKRSYRRIGKAIGPRPEARMSQSRLYLDEDAMRNSLVFSLRARYKDVLTALEAGMVNRDDKDHLAAAAASGRVLYKPHQPRHHELQPTTA